MNAVTTIKVDTPADFFDGPFHLSIRGKLVGAKKTFGVIDPARGQVFAQAPDFRSTADARAGQTARDDGASEVGQAVRCIRERATRRLPVEIVEENDMHVVELHHVPPGTGQGREGRSLFTNPRAVLIRT